ncbi:hypothetical protein NDU88_005285 [Pleurodeles waltl]|uniref:Uncharacterized protein n=1 Tax=Pleurodeles waltl TaxID=8319 RepID=A0AAV7VM81_PLEWA|nr:hypothetical protein NDU88_005285 [Pleurodeles waltl]
MAAEIKAPDGGLELSRLPLVRPPLGGGAVSGSGGAALHSGARTPWTGGVARHRPVRRDPRRPGPPPRPCLAAPDAEGRGSWAERERRAALRRGLLRLTSAERQPRGARAPVTAGSRRSERGGRPARNTLGTGGAGPPERATQAAVICAVAQERAGARRERSEAAHLKGKKVPPPT